MWTLIAGLITTLKSIIGIKTDVASTTVNTTNPIMSYIKGITNTTNTITTDIGTKSDAIATAINTTNSVMAYEKGILSNIGLKGDTAATTVTTTNSAISYEKGILNHLLTNLSNTRMSKIDTIAASSAISSGIIRSIQKGIHGGSTSDISITINSVTPEKCFVILNPSRISSLGAYHSRLISLTSTILTVSASFTSASNPNPPPNSLDTNGAFSWQVIEFY